LASADAIAFLGDTLISLLQSGLAGLVPTKNISLSTPADFKSAAPVPPAVTIFLYHAGINGEMRNAGPPLLGSGATRPPSVPIDVRFLITPWTITAREAYHIIGVIAVALADNALLGFGDLQGGSDVWAVDDTVALILESLPVEEHYDIWAPADIPYRLSLSYLARVMGLDSMKTRVAPPVIKADLAPTAA
jgi:hypothetical protein